MELIFSIINKINPFYSVLTVLTVLFISIFLGFSNKKAAKKFLISLTALFLFFSIFFNIYGFTIGGNYSSFLLSFEIMQVIEISIILFIALSMLFFISFYNIDNTHFIKILILFLFSIICAIFVVISRNFLILFLSWCIFLITTFQLVTSLNTKKEWLSARKYLLKFFLNSFLVIILFFFGFSIVYGSTDFKNFRQIAESEVLVSTFVIISTIIFGIAIYMYLFLFPFQGTYLKFMYRCEYSSSAIIWFLYFPVGIFMLFKLNEVIYYFFEGKNYYISLVFIVLSFVCMIGANIGAIRTKSLRRILSFIFLFYIGIFLLNYSMLSSGLLSRNITEWLDILNLIVLVVSFLPVYGFLVHIEKNRGSDNIFNLRGILKSNTYLSINILIILLSLCGMAGTMGYVSRYYYIEPFISQFRTGNFLNMGFLNLIIFFTVSLSFIFLIVNIFRIIIQFFLTFISGDKVSKVIFPKFYYVYVSFFTAVILVSGIMGLLDILNIGSGYFVFLFLNK